MMSKISVKGDIVAFQAIENKGDLKTWKLSKLEPESD